MGYANIKAAFAEEAIQCLQARVAVHDGEDKHYFVNDEGDYVVTLLTLHHESPIAANWSFPAGQFSLPEINDEVLVGFDYYSGFEGEAYVICRTSSNVQVPDGEAGEFAPGQHIVLGDRSEIRVATKAILQAPTVLVDSGTVQLGGSSGLESLPKTGPFYTALDTLIAAIGTAVGGIPGGAAAGTAIANALIAFQLPATRAAYTTINTKAK